MTTDKGAEGLQDLILTRLRELGDDTGPLTAREAARRSDPPVSYETIRNLARGVRHTGRITDRVAEGLARALEIPVARVYEAAGAPPRGEQWAWPKRFERLEPAQRELVEDVAAALLEAYDRGFRQRAENEQK